MQQRREISQSSTPEKSEKLFGKNNANNTNNNLVNTPTSGPAISENNDIIESTITVHAPISYDMINKSLQQQLNEITKLATNIDNLKTTPPDIANETKPLKTEIKELNTTTQRLYYLNIALLLVLLVLLVGGLLAYRSRNQNIDFQNDNFQRFDFKDEHYY